jgi:hypothetical protein
VDGDRLSHAWAVRVEEGTFVRAELWRETPGEAPVMRALSNPIYLTVDPA